MSFTRASRSTSSSGRDTRRVKSVKHSDFETNYSDGEMTVAKPDVFRAKSAVLDPQFPSTHMCTLSIALC